MRQCFASALWVALFTAASVFSPAEDLALVGGKIYTSPDEPAINNGSIVIHDGKIHAFGPADSVRVPAGTHRISCKGLTVTAGF